MITTRLFNQIKKTPTILQIEAVECGSVALAIVLAYYGRWIPLDILRTDCGVSRDGSRADNIFRAAEKHGLEASAYSVEPDEVHEFHLPAIIHWEFNHFVVLEGVSRRHVYINDPAYGKRILSWDEFDEAFTGILLELIPGPDFVKAGHKPKILPSLLSRLSHSKFAVFFIVLATLALAIPGIAVAGLNKIFIDEVLIQQITSWQRPILAGLIIAALFNALLTWYQRIILGRLETKIALVSGSSFFWHLLRLPMSFFSQRYLGDILNRLQSSDSVASLVSQQFGTNMVNLLLAFIYLVILFLLSIPLTLLVLASTTLNVLILFFIAQRRTSESQRTTKALNNLTSAAVSGLQMIETYKASGAEGDFFRNFTGKHANYLIAEQQLGWTRDCSSVVPTALELITNTAILGFGAWLTIQGEMTIGTVIGFQLLYRSFIYPIKMLVMLSGKIQEISADLFTIEDITSHKLAHRYLEPATKTPIANHKLTGHVVFENVTFGYNPLAEPLLSNFSLEIKPGKRVALVGSSGSGKSTIGKLLLSYYQPWSGNILIDDMLLQDIPNEVKVLSIASVDQDINLFHATLKDNLTLWDQTVKDEEILNACKAVLMHDVIAGSREYGYESMMDEGGSNFSGGQRQRLEIARALLQKPSILILDEATSSLDAQMEQIIDSHLRQLGCTLLIISHRLSTIRDADEIIMLDQGRVVERGTHQELLALQGAYCHLLASEA
ncbi:NHLP family bacteriocin export ABC transporter peptidase/permease/ATPase subunit [Legionella cardiaca]|uniref:NHLP family bacteriocin export ABC transporter peptidase/permease/ATPase subunit n=1 Tax=Legionella cardiaca TaxID=1071983 RepID=A0ABY8AVC4_9GAMM|nr:NHLP family bacteriocin export ABC transporter peptidase/permease/ATPase subunit [Legionella cardiaca]WED44428.1 NHLP family bacteriocin export ABC transporter peptidase/permease/ATPase subunit [Legionella cardiaca]